MSHRVLLHDAIMLRRSVIALILALLISSVSAFAQERAAPPANGSGPAPANGPGVSAPVVTSTSGIAAPDAGDCGEALRHETALHQQQAAATHSLPAPLVLPPECGGTPSPSSAK